MVKDKKNEKNHLFGIIRAHRRCIRAFANNKKSRVPANTPPVFASAKKSLRLCAFARKINCKRRRREAKPFASLRLCEK